MLRLLREIADAGRMVVVATHDERMMPLADRTIELSPRHLRGRPGARERCRLAEGEILFRQGDLSDLVYVVEEGDVELVRGLADGGEEVLARYGPGEYFGELGPMFRLRRSATARAIGSLPGRGPAGDRLSSLAPATERRGRAGAKRILNALG